MVIIFKNALSFFGSLVFNRFLNFLTSIVLVRYLGPAGLGQYTFVLTLAGLFALFCDLGIGQLLIREVSKDNSRAAKYLGNYLFIQLLLSGLVFSIMLGMVSLYKYPAVVKLALVIMGLNLVVVSFSQPFYNITMAFDKLRFNAISTVISNVFYCLCILAAVYFRRGLLMLVTANLLTSIIELSLAVFICTRFCARPKFIFDREIWFTVGRNFIPFGLYLIFTGFYRQIDIIMLSAMKTVADVGFYSAAFKIIYLFLLIPTSFSKAIFPLLSKEAQGDQRQLSGTISFSMKYLLALSFPLAIAGTLFAPEIISLLFGQKFLASSLVLIILIWDVVLVFWHSTLCQSLIASNKMISVVWGSILAFILNLGLNFLLIPKYSYLGAAWATLASELVVGLWFYLATYRLVHFKHPVIEVAQIVFASLIMFIALYFVRINNLFIALLFGLAVYLVALLGVRFISPKEKTLLLNLVNIKTCS